MEHKPLLSADIYDALGDLVRALGGYKSVGIALRPELPADQAGRWVHDCLNREHRAKFEIEQVLWLLRQGRAAGSHGAMAFVNTSCGYAAPAPVDPEDATAKLQREFVEAAQQILRISAALGIDHKLPASMRVVK